MWPLVVAVTTLGTLAALPTAALGQTEDLKGRSVLLITLDTFRGDALGAAGSGRVPTPNLDRLAEGGVFFTRARSPVPLTLPAHASLLTGLNPPDHGVRDNGRFRLAPEQTTLAERLSRQGYRTAAFVGAFVLDHRFGLDQGFDHYDDAIAETAEALESLEAERSGERVLDAFTSWLEALDAADRWFAWVHLYDPHAPYHPPEPYRTRHAGDLYGGEIAYTDFVVGRLIEALEAGKWLSRTILAVSGDHGEGLGEHDEATHSLLIYNSTLHVPLILNGPGVPRARRVAALVRTIDLAPTLLDYLGDRGGLGQGISLRRLIEGDEAPPSLEAYSESLYGRFHLGWSPLHGLETERFRFIRAPTSELFDLSRDPQELDNRAALQPGITRQLRERLESLAAPTTGSSSKASGKIDEETKARLRTLGYLTAEAPSGPDDEELPDPKEKMETYHRIQRAQFSRSRSDCKRAIEELGPLAVERIPVVFELLGACYMDQERWPEAARVFRTALSKGLEQSLFHLNLGISALRQGEIQEAEKELRIALALDEGNVATHYHLGDVLRARGRNQEAMDAYRRALAINPRYVYAWNGLGILLARLGRNDEAALAFEEVVRFDPAAPLGHLNLAALHERMGRTEQALEGYRRFLETSSEGEFPRERERAREAIDRLERPGAS